MYRVLVSFVGTCLSRAEVIVVLTAVHMTSMSSNSVERNDTLASATVALGPSKSAFSKRRSFFESVSHGMAGVTYQTMQCHGRSLVQSAGEVCI